MSVIGLFSQIQSAVYCGGWSTYCSPIDKKSVKVHKHPSGLFGVGLLEEVSVEVAQLGDRRRGSVLASTYASLSILEIISTEGFLPQGRGQTEI